MNKTEIIKIGSTYNDWTVVEKIGPNIRRKLTYKCICKCGYVKIQVGSDLKANNTTKCRKCFMKILHGDPIEIIGVKFGKLLVIRYLGMDKHRHKKYETICDCGIKRHALDTNLKTSKTHQCKTCKSKQMISTRYGMTKKEAEKLKNRTSNEAHNSRTTNSTR